VTVTPTDGTKSGTALTSAAITILDSAPVVTTVGLGPSPATETSTLTCSVTTASTDADGDTVTYAYTWKVNGSAVGVSTSTLTGANFSHGDTVTCTVTPTDGSVNGIAVTSNTVNVINTAPVLTSVTLTPSPAFEGSTMNCARGSASDADGDSISYTYRWTVNSATVSGQTSTTLTGTYFNKNDTVACLVTPTDGTNAGTEVASNPISISNSPPSLTSVSISPSTLYTDTDAAAIPSGPFDPDGDAVTYRYQWYKNSTAINGQTAATLQGTQFVKNDVIYVIVTPYDGTVTGNPVQSSNVTIQNSSPTTPGVTVTPATAQPGNTLTCSVTTASTDADGDAITYSYQWTKNGTLTGITTNTVPGSTPTANHDTWICYVTPSDGTATGSAGSDDQYVVDRTAPGAPVLTGLSPYRNETTITVAGTAEANASITVYAQCSTSGTRSFGATANGSGNFSLNISDAAGDTCSFYAYATDSDGNQSAVSNTVSTQSCAIVDAYEDTTATATRAATRCPRSRP